MKKLYFVLSILTIIRLTRIRCGVLVCWCYNTPLDCLPEARSGQVLSKNSADAFSIGYLTFPISRRYKGSAALACYMSASEMMSARPSIFSLSCHARSVNKSTSESSNPVLSRMVSSTNPEKRAWILCIR